MGCWNGTCGVSQLPILAGMKVRAFLMLQSEYARGIGGAGTCYPTAYFRPWFFPVTAEYNDYGSIENINEDWNAKYMLETFQRWLAEGNVKILGNKEAEINSPDVRKFNKLTDVFECVERGALIIKDHGEDFDEKVQKWVLRENKYLKIGMFMVLENVFNAVVTESNRFLNLEQNNFYKKSGEEARAKAINVILRARAKTGSEKIMNKVERCTGDMFVDQILGDLIDEHSSFKHYKMTLYNPEAVSVEDFLAKLDEVKAFATAMTYLRKMWFPQTGQGSQNEELSFNKALVESMSEHIGYRNAEMEEQRIEDEKWRREYEAKEAAKKTDTLKKDKKETT